MDNDENHSKSQSKKALAQCVYTVLRYLIIACFINPRVEAAEEDIPCVVHVFRLFFTCNIPELTTPIN